MLKRVLSLIVVVMTFALASCSLNQQDQSNQGKKSDGVSDVFDGKWDLTSVTITTGPSGGTHEIVGAAAAEIWNRHISGVKFSSVPSSGTTANISILESGDAQVASSTGDSAVCASNGVPPFDKTFGNLRAMFSLYPNTLQIWVQEKSNIYDFSDLIDKRFTFASPGSGPFQPTLNMMKIYGFSEDDVEKAGGSIEYLDWSTAVSKLQDGLLDAVVWTTSYPAGKIVEAETTRNLRLLQLNEEKLDEFRKTYGGWISVTIPAGTYKNQLKDVTTIGTPNFLMVLDNADNDLIYEMTKALWENKSTLGNTHALLKDINLKNVASGIGVELHPGALKYYQEIGAAVD